MNNDPLVCLDFALLLTFFMLKQASFDQKQTASFRLFSNKQIIILSFIWPSWSTEIKSWKWILPFCFFCPTYWVLFDVVLFSKSKKADATQIFHDTAGWKHLETSMRWELFSVFSRAAGSHCHLVQLLQVLHAFLLLCSLREVHRCILQSINMNSNPKHFNANSVYEYPMLMVP